MWKSNLSAGRGSAVCLGLALLAACGDSPTAAGSTPESGFAALSAGDFEQRVSVTPAKPSQGEQIVIRSEVIHRGPAALTVTSRICGLDLESGLELSGSLLMCAGYSMRAPLEPGDTLHSFEAVVVGSGPGRYTLRVRHLIAPELWVNVPIVVN